MNKWIMMGLLMLSVTRVDAFYGGGKSLGMGVTGTANPQDAIDPAMNPASWAKIDDRIDVGAYALEDRGNVKIRNNFNPNPLINNNASYNSTHTNWTGGGSFGGKKSINDWLAVGLAVYPTTYSKTTFKSPIALYGTSNLGLEFRNLIIEPGVGIDLGCLNPCGTSLGHHYFGLSARCVIQRFKLNGLQNFANPVLSSSFTNVTNKNYEYSTGVAPVIGWLGVINEYISLGASYQPRIKMSKLKKYKGIIADSGNLNVPEEWSVGILISPSCDMHLAFDITRVYQHKTPIFGNTFFPNVFNAQAGDKNGLGFGLRDQTFYRVGGDYSFNSDITVRAGYVYATKTTRSPSAMSDILLTNYYRNVITFGATYKPTCNIELDAYVDYGFKVSSKADNSIPLLFGGGDIHYNTQRVLFGLQFSWLM